MTTNTPIMLWGQGDDVVVLFLRCWRVFHSIRSLRLGDNFFPHISGKAFRFYTNKDEGYGTIALLKSALTCSGMECGIDEGKEIINARSIELQKMFP